MDANGDIISTGQFNQIVDFDRTTEFFTPHNGGTDIFVHKLSSEGNFLWVKTMGGGGFDTGFGIDIAPNSDIVTVGRFSNLVDFNPATNQNNTLVSDGSWDGFVSRFDSLGNFIWVKKLEELNRISARQLIFRLMTILLSGCLPIYCQF